MYHIFFIHSSVYGHLGSFHILATVNSAVVNIGGACILFYYNFPRYMTRNRIVVSYDSFIFLDF